MGRLLENISESSAVHTETAEERVARKVAKKAAKMEAKRRLQDLESNTNDSEESCEHPRLKKSKASPPSHADAIMRRRQFFEQHTITVSGMGSEEFFPALSFAEVEFPTKAQKVISGFAKPMPIQSVCWPVILAKRDTIGIAETGSGKTLGFALPSLCHVLASEEKYAKVLVLAPTRELIMQTSLVYEQLGANVVCLYGGTSKQYQIAGLRKAVDVIAATPGRLIDLVESELCQLSGVTFLVLDEADRMLDTGFERPIRQIITMVHPSRQALFFTATWPESIRKLASEFLEDPITITIGSPDITANTRVRQVVEIVADENKDARLLKLLHEYNPEKEARVLIFVLYKKDAPRVLEKLQRKGYSVGTLHGDSSQQQRTTTMEEFRSGQIKMLVATDVASRGLDVNDIEYVINYSMPLTIEDYVHRIGRTARAGKQGTAHSFFSHRQDKLLGWHLARVLREAGQEVEPELLRYNPPPLKHVDYPTCNISEIKPSPKLRFDDSD
jgi:ATP-dependent RNA helicase DBP3